MTLGNSTTVSMEENTNPVSQKYSTLPATMHKTFLITQGLSGWGVCTNMHSKMYTSAIHPRNKQIGLLCLSTTEQMFLQIQSTIIFNKGKNRGTATVKFGFCSPVTFLKAQRKFCFSCDLPNPPTTSSQSIWHKFNTGAWRRKLDIAKHLGPHFSGGQMKDRCMKSTTLAVGTFTNQNIPLTFIPSS